MYFLLLLAMLDISPVLGNNDPIERSSGRHFSSKRQQGPHVIIIYVLFVVYGETKQAKSSLNLAYMCDFCPCEKAGSPGKLWASSVCNLLFSCSLSS